MACLLAGCDPVRQPGQVDHHDGDNGQGHDDNRGCVGAAVPCVPGAGWAVGGHDDGRHHGEDRDGQRDQVGAGVPSGWEAKVWRRGRMVSVRGAHVVGLPIVGGLGSRESCPSAVTAQGLADIEGQRVWCGAVDPVRVEHRVPRACWPAEVRRSASPFVSQLALDPAAGLTGSRCGRLTTWGLWDSCPVGPWASGREHSTCRRP